LKALPPTRCPAAAPEHSTRIWRRRDRCLTKLTAVLVPERPTAESPAVVVCHFRMLELLAAFALLSRDGRNRKTRTGLHNKMLRALISFRVSLACALRPDALKDKSGDDETKKNSNGAIADVVEIGVRRVALKDAVEKSERELQPGITYPLASRGNPASDGSGTSNKDDERCDRFHVPHEEHDGEKSERSADHATDDSQSTLVERCLSALKPDEGAGNQRG